MQVNITGHGVPVTPALRTYATEKLERLTRRGDRITSIHLVFDIEKINQVAKATLHVAGAEFHAHAEAIDLYSAIDLLVDKLNHQLIKHKEKMKHHQADSLRDMDMGEDSAG